ncbi:bidirectional sugar transporter NEC1-like [Pyrus ussuriensis x Pyrus communis]|uniref:Bidirectional sugar transporter NEC1-like n=1 Tax=Pyrus ussuriensis x Pyrus communis TaxID=2448454 RepID=A0A5N5F684_9ROSA|nr:bidirectional sugar transporter NEC1-like [Pyrus ussuriensis x Pyrus communis]
MAISKMNRLRGGKYKGENGGGMGNGEEGDSNGGMVVRKKGTEDAAVQTKSNMDDKSLYICFMEWKGCWGLKMLHYFGDVYLTKKNVMQRN